MKTQKTTVVTELADGQVLTVTIGADGRADTFELRDSRDADESSLFGSAEDAERVVAALFSITSHHYGTCPDHGRYDCLGRCPRCPAIEMRPAVAPAVLLKSAAQG